MKKLQEFVALWRAEAAVGTGDIGDRILCRCADQVEAALAEQGWRSMDDCPSDDRPVWVWRTGTEPQCMKANGAFWRSLQERVPVKVKNGWTHWHPCEAPPPPPESAR